MLSPARAYDIASNWGSYMNDGDPGAVFYSFRFNDARPDTEDHRAKCIAYTKHLIIGNYGTPADQVELEALRDFFTSTKLRIPT